MLLHIIWTTETDYVGQGEYVLTLLKKNTIIEGLLHFIDVRNGYRTMYIYVKYKYGPW